MAGLPSRSIENKKRDAELHSDKALYPYLNVHIYGPYTDDCFAYLSELKFKLQEAGFKGATICDDRGNQPPEDATFQERKEFWWEESRNFLDNGDVSIFVFLDYTFTRVRLPDRARELVEDSAWHRSSMLAPLLSRVEKWRRRLTGERPKAINTSAIAELMYWLNNIDHDRERTLILFEEGIYREIGSVIPGLVELEDADWEKVENENVDEAYEVARSRCMNWAMGAFRDQLQARHFR